MISGAKPSASPTCSMAPHERPGGLSSPTAPAHREPISLQQNPTVRGSLLDREVIILCVRWYLRFKLSLRDLVEMMAERGLSLAHTTIMRWVWRYAPEFEKRWKRFAQAV